MSPSFQPKPERADKRAELAARIAACLDAAGAPLSITELSREAHAPSQAIRAGLGLVLAEGRVVAIGEDRWAALPQLEELRRRAAEELGASPFGPKDLRQRLGLSRRDVMGWLDALQAAGWVERTSEGHVFTEAGLAGSA